MPKLAALGVDCAKLWRSIDDLIIKTLLCIEPKVKQECDLSVGSSRSCFQLFGFDVLIDAALKPWLLEVNFTPSLAVDAPIDMRIKGNMLADLFTIAGIQPRKASAGNSKKSGGSGAPKAASGRGMIQPPRESERQMRSAGLDGNLTSVERVVAARTADENARAGGFRRIYPNGEDAFFYSQFMERDRVLNFAITNFLFKQRVEAEQDAHVDALALGVMQKRYCRHLEAEAAAAVRGRQKKSRETDVGDGHSSTRNRLTSASSSRSGSSRSGGSRASTLSRDPKPGRWEGHVAVESKNEQPQDVYREESARSGDRLHSHTPESAAGRQSDDSEPEAEFKSDSQAEEDDRRGQDDAGNDFGNESSPDDSAGDFLNYTQFDDNAGNTASVTAQDEDLLDQAGSEKEDIAAGSSGAKFCGVDDVDAEAADRGFTQSDMGVGDETGDYSAEYETEEEQDDDEEERDITDDDLEDGEAGSALDNM